MQDLDYMLRRVHAWRFTRKGAPLTREEYDRAPKDGLTTSQFLGEYDSAAVPPDATHTAPASPRLHEHMALVPPGRTVVSFGLPSCRLDLDDGSAVDEGELRSPRALAAHDRMWLSVRRDD